jgi:ATP/ADP translocase
VDDVPLGLPRPPRRRLLSSRFVLLLIGYQVLSAAGTYMVEFLLFDRAASRYHDTASLASFLSKFTAVLNLVDIVFLALLAGALLRRFGLRLGIAANPALVAALGAAMLVAATVSGSGALALFVLVGAARIVDISLTDGMTRTSINTAFQLLPVEERLAVQATVEGVGVPVAIGPPACCSSSCAHRTSRCP